MRINVEVVVDSKGVATFRQVAGAADQAAESVGGLAKQASFLERVWQGVGQGLGQKAFDSVVAGARMAGDALEYLFERGVKVKDVKDSFDSLTAAAGLSGDALLKAGQEGAAGMISNFDLMAASNKALLLDLPITAEGMRTLAEGAATLGDAIGQGPTEALDTMLNALGRGQDRMLKQMGIDIDAAAAQEKYAAGLGITAEQLSEAGKKAALYQAAIEAVAAKTKDLGGVSLSLDDQLEQVSTRWQNLLDELAMMIQSSPAVISLFASMGVVINDLIGFLEKNKEAFASLLQYGVVALMAGLTGLAGGVTVVLASLQTLALGAEGAAQGILIAVQALAKFAAVSQALTPGGVGASFFLDVAESAKSLNAEVGKLGKGATDGLGKAREAASAMTMKLAGMTAEAAKAGTAAAKVGNALGGIKPPPPLKLTIAGDPAKEIEQIVAGLKKGNDELAKTRAAYDTAEAARAAYMGKLGPSVEDATIEMERLTDVYEKWTEAGGLSEAQMKSFVDQMKKQIELGGDSKDAIALYAKVLDLLPDSSRLATEGIRKTNEELERQAKAAAYAKKLDEWRDAIGQLGDAFLDLGADMQGFGGQLANGLGWAAKAFENFNSSASTAQKSVTAAMGAMAIWKQNQTNMSGGSGAINGAEQGAAAGAQFGAVGTVIGAIAGAFVGFFAGQGFRKMAQQAGAVLGFEISEELAKKIKATMEDLGVDVGAAALLNITAAMEDSGRTTKQFEQQIGQLFAGITNGSVPAKQGIEELGRVFGAAQAEAAAIGKTYNATTVAMIQSARQTGIEFPGMTEAVSAGLEKVIAGAKRLRENLDLTAGGTIGNVQMAGQNFFGGEPAGWNTGDLAANAEAQGELFASSFWAVVGERGLVAGADAFRETFDGLRESFKDALPPEALDALVGPIERILELTAPGEEGGPAGLFRGAAEAALGLKDIIDGLAESGYITGEALANAGTLTQNAFDQAIAGGATEREALMAIMPALQANIDAAAAYGLQLDSNTQALVDQATANGLTFKVDPMMQMVDILKAIAEVLGATLPASAQTATASFQQTGQSGSASASSLATSFDEAGKSIAESMTSAANVSESVMDGMVSASERGWAQIGTASGDVLGSIASQLGMLGNGVTVPITFAQTGPGIPAPSGYGGGEYQPPEFAGGGIGRGPMSGYSAVLHGTEAVLSLPQLYDNMASIVSTTTAGMLSAMLRPAMSQASSSGGSTIVATSGNGGGESLMRELIAEVQALRRAQENAPGAVVKIGEQEFSEIRATNQRRTGR